MGTYAHQNLMSEMDSPSNFTPEKPLMQEFGSPASPSQRGENERLWCGQTADISTLVRSEISVE